MKQQILHIIDSLARGGAELILVKFIESLPKEYENFLVILRDDTDLLDELSNVTKVYKLGWRSKKDILYCAFKLRSIIQEKNIGIVHAHLYWSTIVARLATPSQVPLLFTVHNELSQEVFKGSAAGRWLERLTYSPEQYTLFVSEAVKEDYARHVALGCQYQVIHNFVDDAFYKEENRNLNFSAGKLKLVTVASLKRQKNHQLLLQAMANLTVPEVSLDIIGEGPERVNLQKQIDDLGLQNVCLRGVQDNLAVSLKNYDTFILASSYEGFCVAMAEAMAVGLPCLVSDLPVLRDISKGSQLYFSPGNVDELTRQIQILYTSRNKLEQMKQAGVKTAQSYKMVAHTAAVVKIYEQLLKEIV